jgi:bacterioferritin (cytochrome b1)
MDRFIRRQNLEHYRELLKTVTDPVQRDTIEKLIAEEEEKQKNAGDVPGMNSPPRVS